MLAHEGSALLTHHRQDHVATSGKRTILLLLAICLSVIMLADCFFPKDFETLEESLTLRYPLLGYSKDVAPPEPKRRCEWVHDRFQEQNAGVPSDELRKRYVAQSIDSNVFYRATAHLFWRDFSNGCWGNLTLSTLKGITLRDGIPLVPKSTWTWVTGDQHLSNFGAWRNRHGDVVFSVNDFDEAAIYDFHVDILRIAVSIYNHAKTNGLSKKEINKAIHVFTKSYVDTVIGYVGNEKALLFELTPDTAHGVLNKFLKVVKKENSATKQLKKFTGVDPATGLRSFIKGGINVPHNETNLAAVPREVEAKIRNAFSSTHYGATMMKLGWNVREWDDEYFSVLDVAERVGSGIGSFGVDRYYVLLKGTDGLLGKDEEDAFGVILDVKFQPRAAVESVLSANDAAWYRTLFSNAAARVVEAQRRLTSYVDPFTGWILLEDKQGMLQPFSIRQRSPWKDSMDLNHLTDTKDFHALTAQIAIITATSHVRGSVAKAPADFKNVIHAIMNKKSNEEEWGSAVARLAKAYHEQVLLDFECFHEFVKNTYGAKDTSM